MYVKPPLVNPGGGVVTWRNRQQGRSKQKPRRGPVQFNSINMHLSPKQIRLASRLAIQQYSEGNNSPSSLALHLHSKLCSKAALIQFTSCNDAFGPLAIFAFSEMQRRMGMEWAWSKSTKGL